MKKNIIYILSSLYLIIVLLAINSKTETVSKNFNIDELFYSQKYYIESNHNDYLSYYTLRKR